MSPHPVHLHITSTEHRERAHVAIRLLFLMALGLIGCSSVYWLLYLALPAVAALLLSRRGAQAYLAEDAPGMVRILRWLAAAYAYLWLLTDQTPEREPGPEVDLRIVPAGRPTRRSALLRVLTSFPALLLLAILSFFGGFLWFLGALWILLRRRLPHALADYLAMTLRYQFRLVAYHLSLVDAYPSLAGELPVGQLPQSGAA